MMPIYRKTHKCEIWSLWPFWQGIFLHPTKRSHFILESIERRSSLEVWNYKQRLESEGFPNNPDGSGIDSFPQWMNHVDSLSSIIPLKNHLSQTHKPHTEKFRKGGWLAGNKTFYRVTLQIHFQMLSSWLILDIPFDMEDTMKLVFSGGKVLPDSLSFTALSLERGRVEFIYRFKIDTKYAK